MSQQEYEQLLKDEGRHFTTAEIDRIVEGLPPIPSASITASLHLRAQHQQRLRDILEEEIIIDEIVDEITEIILHKFVESLISPGEAAGNIAAGAISAPATQLKLSAYHLIGGTTGDSLKSLLEIFGRRKDRDPENLHIHFKHDNMTESEVQELMYRIEGITIMDLLDPIEGEFPVKFDGKLSTLREHIPWLQTWMDITKSPLPYIADGVFFRMKLNVSQLYAYKVTIDEIKSYLETIDGIRCVPSPTILGYLDIFVDSKYATAIVSDVAFNHNMSTMDIVYQHYEKAVKVTFTNVFGKGRVPTLKNAYIRETTLQRKLDMREEKVNDDEWKLWCDATETRMSGITDNKIKIFMRANGLVVLDSVYRSGRVYYHVKSPTHASEKSIIAIIKKQVSLATKNFNKYREESEEKGLYETTMDFEGGELFRAANYCHAIANTNAFKKILSNPHVEGNRTILKNPYRVYLTLGIEAARNVIIREVWDIINDSGSSISARHITLIADLMCWIGTIIATSSRGASRLGRETLSDSTFEKPLDFIRNAAVRAEKETTKSTSTCILLGTKCGLGTGTVEVGPDPDIPIEYFNANDDIGKDYTPTLNIGFDIGAPSLEIESQDFVIPDMTEIRDVANTDTIDAFRPGLSGDDATFTNPSAKGSVIGNIESSLKDFGKGSFKFEGGGEFDNFDDLLNDDDDDLFDMFD